ncbi:hypothetical protein C1H46_042724 [Malus baccata]|uniref:Uncharacterized protein n=1 Tax=Malus baccata TaxID=106549 RepID=A0A540KC71_MALBA|nr:hypothetical protein C1H46_042724 [Malus baccata]
MELCGGSEICNWGRQLDSYKTTSAGNAWDVDPILFMGAVCQKNLTRVRALIVNVMSYWLGSPLGMYQTLEHCQKQKETNLRGIRGKGNWVVDEIQGRRSG